MICNKGFSFITSASSFIAIAWFKVPSFPSKLESLLVFFRSSSVPKKFWSVSLPPCSVLVGVSNILSGDSSLNAMGLLTGLKTPFYVTGIAPVFCFCIFWLTKFNYKFCVLIQLEEQIRSVRNYSSQIDKMKFILIFSSNIHYHSILIEIIFLRISK